MSSLESLEDEYQEFLVTNNIKIEGSLFENILKETLANIVNDKKNTIYIQKKTGTDAKTRVSKMPNYIWLIDADLQFEVL